MRLLPLFLVLMVASPLVFARMYQWDDPDTGTPQLSGKPPYWYRSDEKGPRVFVIDNGRVIDDTSVQLPDNRRLQLREEAFLRAEQDESRFKAKLEEAQRLKSERDRSRKDEVVATKPAAPPVGEEAATDAAAAPEAGADSEVEVMRALVEEWEKFREESAKKIVYP